MLHTKFTEHGNQYIVHVLIAARKKERKNEKTHIEHCKCLPLKCWIRTVGLYLVFTVTQPLNKQQQTKMLIKMHAVVKGVNIQPWKSGFRDIFE